MMEALSLGSRRFSTERIRPRAGLLGDVGDLLAYRRMWEPFIGAHLALWRDLNDRFENSPDVKRCPAGIFDVGQIQTQDPVWRSWCASLALTRMMTSATDQRGILPAWNAWANKSSSEILNGARDMLDWHQKVVLRVGGPDKTKLLEIAKQWEIPVRLPDLPPFNEQQEVRARIEGAYITTKGLLQIIGYGTEETMKAAGTAGEAVAEGLTDTAKKLKEPISPWVWVGGMAVFAIVGGALVVYYVPRRRQEPGV